ncbi:sensor histidine kinase [Blautia massiliensis (ex Durand et al. 2017)]|uniref:sensor histidine kinase n=1 Tax=Blautia massiliensis (ex Durand et al. 2017) TaxID=1737424 RepID=UPI002FE6C5A7
MHGKMQTTTKLRQCGSPVFLFNIIQCCHGDHIFVLIGQTHLHIEDTVLLISDDGVGISPEILSTILSGKGKSQSGGTNIAVYNTHRRLQILYGNDYGLTYSSKPGEGTDVEIRFPAHREK